MLWWIYLACNLSFEDKNNPNGLLLSIFRWNKERKLETLWWDKTTHNRWWLYFFLPLYNEESVNSLHINRAMVKSQSIQKNHIGQIRFKQEKERERERKEQKCSINRTLIYIIFKKRKEKKCDSSLWKLLLCVWIIWVPAKKSHKNLNLKWWFFSKQRFLLRRSFYSLKKAKVTFTCF